MSLFVRISTLDNHITTLVATRHSGEGSDPDSVNNYAVDRIVGTGVIPVGTIKHRYGEGAMVLARKMIEQAHALDKWTGRS